MCARPFRYLAVGESVSAGGRVRGREAMRGRKGRKEKGDEKECVWVRKRKCISGSVCVRGKGEKESERERECICVYT
jgi:hypothetical protein